MTNGDTDFARLAMIERIAERAIALGWFVAASWLCGMILDAVKAVMPYL